MSSLNLKVRLPGSNTPVQTTVGKATTASAFISHIATRYNLSGLENRSVVIAPESGAHAKIIPFDSVIDGTSQSEVIELWASPYTINVGVSDGLSGMKESRELAVDIAMPLTQMVPLFQRIFQSVNKELFVFRYLEADASETKILDDRWLNANLPLEQQNFHSEGWLVLYPVTSLALKISTEVPLKEGYMLKQTLKKSKYSKQKKKYFICKDFFLYYFRNKEDSHAKGVLPLEYFYCKMQTTRDTETGKNKVSIILRRCLVARTMKVGEEYVLTSSEPENNKEMREWFEVLKSLCIAGNDTRVFGVDLKEIASRKKETNIPSVILKTVSYLKVNSVAVEGVFRISGSSSLIEFYRDRFDQGDYIDLQQCTDVHTIASLLRQYLRELPEPLLTHELHDQFVSSHEEQVAPEQRVKLALKAVEQLPEQNRAILYYLCVLLGRVAEHADVTRMTPSNLGTVFGMNIVFGPQNETSRHPIEVILQKTPLVNSLMETLIVHHKKFTESPTFPAHMVPGLSDTVVDFEEEFRTAKTEQSTPPADVVAPRKMSKSNAKAAIHTKPPNLPSREASNPSFMKDGWLDKQSDVRKRWKRRYFVCTEDTLHFYKSNKDTKPEGSISLHDCVVGTSSVRPFCLAISTTSSRKNYYACAASQIEVDEWFNLLNRLIRELNPAADFNAQYAASPPKRVIYGGDDISGFSRTSFRAESPSVNSSPDTTPVVSPTPPSEDKSDSPATTPKIEVKNKIEEPHKQSTPEQSRKQTTLAEAPKLAVPEPTTQHPTRSTPSPVVTKTPEPTPPSSPQVSHTPRNTPPPEPIELHPEPHEQEIPKAVPAKPAPTRPKFNPARFSDTPATTAPAPTSTPTTTTAALTPRTNGPNTPAPDASVPSTTPKFAPTGAPKLVPIAKPAQSAVAVKFALKPIPNSPLHATSAPPSAPTSDNTSTQPPTTTVIKPSSLKSAAKTAAPQKPAAAVLKPTTPRTTSPIPATQPPQPAQPTQSQPTQTAQATPPTQPLESPKPVLKPTGLKPTGLKPASQTPAPTSTSTTTTTASSSTPSAPKAITPKFGATGAAAALKAAASKARPATPQEGDTPLSPKPAASKATSKPAAPTAKTGATPKSAALQKPAAVTSKPASSPRRATSPIPVKPATSSTPRASSPPPSSSATKTTPPAKAGIN